MPFNYCSDPFDLPRHKCYTKGVRPINPAMRNKHPFLKSVKFLCTSCRAKVTLGHIGNRTPKAPDINNTSHHSDDVSTDTIKNPVTPPKNTEQEASSTFAIKSPEFIDEKITKSPESICEEFTLSLSTSDTSLHEPSASFGGQANELNLSQTSGQLELKPGTSLREVSIMRLIKEKLSTITDETSRMFVLTLHPPEWSVRRLAREFAISREMAGKVKKLMTEKGALGNPNATPFQFLIDKTISLIKDVYRCDEMSRPMTGTNDLVRVSTENGEIHLRKRLVLSNLNELYSSFRELYPTIRTSFSQFAELQPQECRFAGYPGIHCFSTCVKHQNIRLMIEGPRFDILTRGSALSLNSYEDFLAKLICNPPQVTCYLGKCAECPGTKPLRCIIDDLFEDSTYVKVMVKCWSREDSNDARVCLINRDFSPSEYIDCLLHKLEAFLPHDFITRQQFSYFQMLKDNLQEGEFLVVSDFSQNYVFVSQDSLRNSYFDENAATIHPFVAYYKIADDLHSFNHVVISESLHHNPIAVHLFQKKFHNSLREHFPVIKTIYYFTDGAEYRKRKTLVNLCFHTEDFGYPAEWHFFAASHGKRPCDFLSGTLRRDATRANLEKTEIITTARDLYEFARDHFFNITFNYCTNTEYDKQEEIYADRYSSRHSLSGRAKLSNAFIPISKTEFRAKLYSFADEFETYDLLKS